MIAQAAHQRLGRDQKRLGVVHEKRADLGAAGGAGELFGRLDDAFVVGERLGDLGEVGLVRVLRAQQALGLDHQRLDVVARLACLRFARSRRVSPARACR